MAKKRRSKVRKVITLLVTASLVAGGGYVGYQKYTETKAAEPSGQSDTESTSAPVVKTAQATKGTIASTVVGSGTLSDGDSEDVTIPTGITIDQVLVESGDTVKKGDALATVDLENASGISKGDTVKVMLSDGTEENGTVASVTERTREIGIRKAIGAGNGSIMAQFLVEALMLSLMGCGAGGCMSPCGLDGSPPCWVQWSRFQIQLRTTDHGTGKTV